MAGNAPNFNISIGAVTTELKKGLQEARRELQNFQKEVNSRKLNPDYKASMQAERIEGQKLTNQIKAVRLESAQLTLEQRKNKTATDAASGSYREAQQRLTALGRSIREARNGFTQNSASINKQIKEYNQLNSQLKAFDARMGNFQRNVGNYPNAMGALSAISPQISQLASKGGGLLGLALGLKNAYDTASLFDSGLKNVQKTTGLTQKDTKALGDEFINLSRNLETVSTTKLTEYATVAGQLGVKGTQNILNFTEALAKLETASDITGEQGGAEIARLLTLTDGGVQNVKRFSNEIVNLGNNFAATESEILGNATRIAQSTGVYKLGRENVLAYATATKSVGVEAELVGSSIGRTLGVIEGLSRSTKGAEQITKLLGISQAELQKRFKENSGQVLTDFIAALRRVDEAGGSVNGTLENLGIRAIRDKTVLGSLATNGFNVLTDAIDKTRNAGNALDEEFETASGKISNQVGRIKIAWENLVLSFEQGTGIIGKVSVGFADMFASVLEGFTSVVSSRSYKEFFASLGMLSGGGGNAISAAAGATFNRLNQQRTNPNGRARTQLERAVSRATNGFSEASNEEKLLRIRQQTEAVQARTAEYRAKSDKENLDRLTLQNAVLAEMNKLYYGQLDVKKKVGAVDLTTPDKGKTKGKTQAEIIKEANDALAGGQANALRGLDGELSKIDNKWAGILEKINKIADVGLRNQLQGVAAINKEAEKYNKFLEAFAKSPVDFGRKAGGNIYRNVPTQLSGVLQSPSSLPLLERNQNRINTVYGKNNLSSYYQDPNELSRYMERVLRSGFANTITSIFEDIGKIAESNLEIEQKYAKLRQESTADQIEGLRKMQKLEKSINNGFTKLLQNTTASFSQLGTRTLSGAIGEGVSTGDFSQLTKLFKGDNKALGYGALASSLGGVISGVSNNPGAKTFGSILSLGGTGAAIGSTIAPGIGTIIGAAAGVIIGAISGILNTGEQKKQSELQNLQLLEQKKQTDLQNRIAALSYQSSIVGQVTNQGVVTGIDRDAYGNLVATISGSELQIILNRAKNQRG